MNFFGHTERSPKWFRRLDAKLRTAFKQIHRSRGIYTGSNHGQIYRQLADLKDLNSPPEWPKKKRKKQEFVATSRLNKAGQERETQKQIRRNQANARLIALRAIVTARSGGNRDKAYCNNCRHVTKEY
jgi:hypothetical protein